MNSLNYRVVIFLFAFVFGVVFSIPSLTQSEEGKKITLGLDLQGGLHMLLSIKSEVAVESKVKSIGTTVKYNLEDEDVIFDELKIADGKVIFEILDKDDLPKVTKILAEEFKDITVNKNGMNFELIMSDKLIEDTKQNAINQAVDTIRNRLNMFGLAEPTVAKQGEDKILVEVPGIKTAEDEQRIRSLIAKAAHLQMMAVDEDRASRVDTMSDEEAKQFGDVILRDVADENQKYLLYSIPILDGSMLVDAKVGYDQQNNQPLISFKLNGQGAKIFGDFSGKSVGKRMAVVLDGKVYSAPVIRERIGGGSGQISGNFTPQEAHDVAIALRSGALLAPVQVEEKRSVGPSLGADSIKASSIALIIGFLAVVVFMFFYYGMAGAISNAALIANLFLILAVMSMFEATLTLPGMAGIVLTVGMAVDANVIINERIRELLHAGNSITKSIEQGYNNAFTAIWDANITTLIAAVVLFAYGTGPIKGFSLTISIGILASMLTAILGTHGIYQWILPKIKKDRLQFWFGIRPEGRK
ncbi:protein translocase subunit SecD [Sulfurovum sp. bin170]|uniref:protein translocase subunit SecD n=1 Tax=Sulfurovum sp. bin170 TaxID=2695268 RepID=UPI0013DF1334|nr:protein translocase subunit SecD [Sulfurovum sp. bin170]NEW60195.1 protein translocase subunit SecD [Sulfurovum sp. bin170]